MKRLLRVAEQVVVDVDAVQQEHVVVREARPRSRPGRRSACWCVEARRREPRCSGSVRPVASLSTTCSCLKLVATCVSVRIDADVPHDLDRLLYVRDGHRGVGLRTWPRAPALEFLLDGAEPRQVERCDVAARRKAPEVVAAGVVGDDRPLALEGGRLQRDGHCRGSGPAGRLPPSGSRFTGSLGGRRSP